MTEGIEPHTEPAAATVAGGRGAELNFSYKGWEVRIQLDSLAPEGCVSCHAEIRAGSYICRLMRAGQANGADQAIGTLAQKARQLIDDRHALAAQSRRDVA